MFFQIYTLSGMHMHKKFIGLLLMSSSLCAWTPNETSLVLNGAVSLLREYIITQKPLPINKKTDQKKVKQIKSKL